MPVDYQARAGHLLLADISGYTKFLTGTELEHAQSIIRELIMLVRERLTPPMRFVKAEGDAVFCYADESVFRDGERLIELIEVCYFEFSNRLLNMSRNTTCSCSACAAIGTLDLKFICHFGTFVVDREGDGVDLAGADVILAHRLLKNTVAERTGLKAYAVLTAACIQQLGVPTKMPLLEEYYEPFGVTIVGVHDLQPALAAMQDRHRRYVRPEEADFTFSVEVPVPPVEAWHYYVNPVQRQRWKCRYFSKKPDVATRNAKGRIGTGASMHCSHGPGTARWEFVDWRPFTSVTHEVTAPRLLPYVGLHDELNTFDFIPTADGRTQVVCRARLKNRSRLARLTYRVQRRCWLNAFDRRTHHALLAVIAQDRRTQPI
ncbi:MAG: DUF2652 domain-containing protein [Mycobacterium sp.]|nr:DUF2652 domain-containing protein [Mycobacterium sp.]